MVFLLNQLGHFLYKESNLKTIEFGKYNQQVSLNYQEKRETQTRVA